MSKIKHIYQITDSLLTIVVQLRKCPEKDGGNTETQEKHVEEEGHVHVAQLARDSARITQDTDWSEESRSQALREGGEAPPSNPYLYTTCSSAHVTSAPVRPLT